MGKTERERKLEELKEKAAKPSKAELLGLIIIASFLLVREKFMNGRDHVGLN